MKLVDLEQWKHRVYKLKETSFGVDWRSVLEVAEEIAFEGELSECKEKIRSLEIDLMLRELTVRSAKELLMICDKALEEREAQVMELRDKLNGDNNCVFQAVQALRHIATHGKPAQGGEQSYNTEHLWQIVDELEKSFGSE